MKNKKNKKQQQPLLELVMIVKNAESVIANTLTAIREYIDSYTILDTGSNDNTISIIREVLKSNKGEIYQEPFVDFATSRNRALELAGTKCKFIIFLDDTYILQGGDQLRKILVTKSEKYESLNIRIYNPDDKKLYYSTRILATRFNIRYKYRVHEIPDTKQPSYIIQDADIFLKDCNTKFTLQRSKVRFERDLDGLYLDQKQYPNDTRILYYLAMTNLMLSRYTEARRWFENFIAKKKEKDEYLYQAYYNLALILYKLKIDWKIVEKYLKSANNLYPDRAEPYYKVASHYYKQGELATAYEILKSIINIPLPNNYQLDVETDIYKIKIPYLYIDTSMILSQHNYPIDNNKVNKLLENCIKSNPENHQFTNIKQMISPIVIKNIIKYEKPLIVFHTSFITNQIWDPQHFNNMNVSGSEIMVRNLSIELAKINYKVIVFGSFKNQYEDFQCVIKGVEFIDNKLYSEWVKDKYIDRLIVSRIPTNIIYLPNISKVYLWMHDIYPDYEYIQAHATKFGGVLALCEWHKDILQEEFNIPLNMIKTTRNAIYADRFIGKNIEKTPYRIIWSSDPYRGLKYLLQMFPKIHKSIPEASLHIFANSSSISEQELSIIRNIPNIVLEDRKSQDDIAIEFLKSDIWLYPTDFEETYCITALEAQAAGCLCVTTNIGSLSEIVGNRGIVVDGDIKDAKTQDLIITKLVEAINTNKKTQLIEKAKEWALKQTYEKLAIEWIDFFK